MKRLEVAYEIIDAAEKCLEYIKEKGAITFLDIRSVLNSTDLQDYSTHHNQVSKILQVAYDVKLDKIGAVRRRLNLPIESVPSDFRYGNIYYLDESEAKRWILENQNIRNQSSSSSR